MPELHAQEQSASGGGQFTRSGSVALPFLAEQASAISELNHIDNIQSDEIRKDLKKDRRSETRGRNSPPSEASARN